MPLSGKATDNAMWRRWRVAGRDAEISTEKILIDGRAKSAGAIEATLNAGVGGLVADSPIALQLNHGDHATLLAEVDDGLSSERLAAIARELRALVAEAHGVGADVALLPQGTLPPRRRGIPPRSLARRAYRRHELRFAWLDKLSPEPARRGIRDPLPSWQRLGERSAGPGAALPLTLEALRRAVTNLLGEDVDLDPKENLISLGLDSIGVMGLASDWRAAGLDLQFGELMEHPTLGDWWALISGRLAGGLAQAPLREGGDAGAHEPFSLTPMQHAYWVGRGDEQTLGGVGCHFYTELDGSDVESARLERAVSALLARHDMLRARFLDDGRQVVAAQSPWRGLTVHDLRGCEAHEQESELVQIRNRLSHRRLEVEHGEVFDVQLSLLPRGLTRLHVNIDLLVADVLSIQILYSDLARLYRDADLEPARINYGFSQYLADQALRRAARRSRARGHWQDRIDDLPGAPALPLRLEPERIQLPRVLRRSHRLTPQETQGLSLRAREHGVTLAMALAAAFAEVLGAFSGSQEFLLNVPLFDREPLHADVSALIGDFTNVILLAVDTSSARSFAETATALQSRFHTDVSHSDYSGVEVLRDFARSHGGEPVRAPVVFTSALGMGDLFDSEVRSLLGSPGWMISQTPQVWLDHQVLEFEGGLLFNWDAVEELFPPELLDAMFEAFVDLLAWLKESDWGVLPDLLPAEQRAARARVNSTQGHENKRLLHDGFLRQVQQRPERLALAWGDAGELTYGELAAQALDVAGLLIEHGAKAGDPVAVTLPKGPAQVVAVLGVLCAGCVYVPVGIDHPARRRTRIYKSAGVRIVLTSASQHEQLRWPDDIEVVDVGKAAQSAALKTPVAVEPEELAYVIYTSGSTGEPKGVEITHRSALNTIEDVNERFSVGEDDRVLAVSALDFDLSVYDLFGLLAVGGAVVLIEEHERREPRRWLELIRRWGVTVWNSVPALLDMLLVSSEDEGVGSDLRIALVSGDWIGLDLPGRLAAAKPECRFVALGGATEAAIWSNYFEVDEVPDDWRSIPYGYPLRNQSFRVVDARGRDCPDWVPGELWISGVGVARGYRGDQELTVHRFVEHAGERWYRTGDLGRYWPDGTLEFLGRVDHQVKVRGHRIELGEIEAVLEEHPGVRDAVALLIAGPARRIAAAIVPADGELDPQHLLAFAAERLPSYALPASYLSLERLPLTANNKVDRQALAALAEEQSDASATEDEPPQGPLETAVAEIWSELLDQPNVGRTQNFFVLGGDSLLATRLITRLRAAGVRGVQLTQLFATPTLADFAATLSLDAAETGQAPALVPNLEQRHDPFPPTEVQRAYWFGRTDAFALGGVGCHFYTELDGSGVDLERLEDALNRLVARHEMLRAVFDEDGQQRILPEVPRFHIDVTDAPGGDAEAALVALHDAMAEQVLDPTRWPVFDLRAVRYGGRVRIGCSFDGILLDALSTMIVLTELEQLYEEPEANLPPVDVSFRDYVLNARPTPEALATAQGYWLGRLSELPPAPQLPVARDPALISRPRFTRRERRLASESWQMILRRAREHDLTPSTLLATAFAEVLGAWSAQPQLTINLTLFDRRDVHPHIGNVLGDFTSLLLVAYRPRPGDGWLERARRLQRQVWRDLEHSEVSAVWVLRELARQTGATEATMPVVFTSTIGVANELAARAARPYAERVGGLSQTPQVWLDHQVLESEGGLLFNWDAVEELFPPGMLDAMFEAYVGLLRWLAESDWDLVPELLPAEQRAVRARVNSTKGDKGAGLLHDGFLFQAEQRPEQLALAWGEDGELSYGELRERALAVAGLVAASGAKPGDPVAVTLPKGPSQLVAVLGVLCAGCVYVPVGIDHPPQRRARIYKSAGVRIVLTSASQTASTEWPGGTQPVDIDAPHCALPLEEQIALSPDALAYVIYTSGSTGEPKGVEITHRSALNTIKDVNERFGVRSEDRVLAVSALDFDLSVYDLFGLLAVGGAIVLIEEHERREPRRWLELVRRWGVTVWNSVPALLDMLLISAGEEGLGSRLRLALVSGDWIGLDLPGRLAAANPGCRFVALGGATEAAIWSNYFEVDEVPEDWRSIPYGYPLRNQAFRVVDARGRDCPDWVPGELWIGGVGVARGYRGDQELTAHRFVERDGDRWYRTGDLGRYWPDGTLEFLGRVDHQVKVRGHRIELGEIEAVLEGHPDVRHSVAVLVGERAQQIAAAIVTATGEFDPQHLSAFAAERLPSYALPASYLSLERLPLTANNKVDRKALAALAEEQSDHAEDAPPQGPLETALAKIWGELLDQPDVGRAQNFISLGGDSVLAAQFVEILRRHLGVELSLREFFISPTVAELAAKIAANADDLDAILNMEQGII